MAHHEDLTRTLSVAQSHLEHIIPRCGSDVAHMANGFSSTRLFSGFHKL